MNVIILGAAGFIGTNLAIALAKDENNHITLVDGSLEYFTHDEVTKLDNVNIISSKLSSNEDFDILEGHDVVYHLVSTTVPTTSNRHIGAELEANIIFSTKMLDACVKHHVGKVVFISSGGTVYGKDVICPISEDASTDPISAYGIQKLTIEKLLYLYNYMYGLDYRIVRLSNPYGPYQRPNGKLGAVTTFTYKALKGETIEVYGDGSVVRDFIYIDDAIRGILKIASCEDEHHVYNLGCGYGTSLQRVLSTIEQALDIKMDIVYQPSRTVDVPVNYLDISRYEQCCGSLNPLTLEEGVKKTAEFMRKKLL